MVQTPHWSEPLWVQAWIFALDPAAKFSSAAKRTLCLSRPSYRSQYNSTLGASITFDRNEILGQNAGNYFLADGVFPRALKASIVDFDSSSLDCLCLKLD